MDAYVHHTFASAVGYNIFACSTCRNHVDRDGGGVRVPHLEGRTAALFLVRDKMIQLAMLSQGYSGQPHHTLHPSLIMQLSSVYIQSVDLSNPGILMPLNMTASQLVQDGGMAEVFRESSRCFETIEGFGGGTWGDCGKPYELAGGFTKDEANCKREVGYGCWFWHAKGTGVFVNVGRSLRVANRCDAHKALGISRLNGSAVDAWCDNPPGDRLYCERARKRGYDSIQIAQSHGIHSPELIMCSGKCMTQTIMGACPPLDMQDASGQKCKCEEDRGAINCGETESSALSQHLKNLILANMVDEEGCNRRSLGLDFENPLRQQALCEAGAVDTPEREQSGTVVIPKWDGLPAKRSLLTKFWHEACKNGLFPPGSCRRMCVSLEAALPSIYD